VKPPTKRDVKRRHWREHQWLHTGNCRGDVEPSLEERGGNIARRIK